MMPMPAIPLRTFDSRVPVIRSELRGDMPMGSTYAPEQALLVAMAEEIRDLHLMVAGLVEQVAHLSGSQ